MLTNTFTTKLKKKIRGFLINFKLKDQNFMENLIIDKNFIENFITNKNFKET